MLESKNFRSLVDYLDASEIFPGVTIKGGVCYFLWDKNYEGKCQVTTINNDTASPTIERYLGEEGDIFIRYNEALPILDRVRKKNYESMENMVSPRKPFGFATNFKDYADEPFKNSVVIFTNAGRKYIKKSQITQNLAPK